MSSCTAKSLPRFIHALTARHRGSLYICNIHLADCQDGVESSEIWINSGSLTLCVPPPHTHSKFKKKNCGHCSFTLWHWCCSMLWQTFATLTMRLMTNSFSGKQSQNTTNLCEVQQLIWSHDLVLVFRDPQFLAVSFFCEWCLAHSLAFIDCP